MNPVIVIPTYWAEAEYKTGQLDHATPVDAPNPDLARCLDSLEQVRGIMRTIILVAAPPEAAEQARARVDALAAEHPTLSPLVIGEPEAKLLTQAVVDVAPRLTGECVSLRGYGALRNLGLIAAAVLNHDVVVFLDDDEIALSPNFLVEGVYGLGQLTRQNLPVLAKSGYFIDSDDSTFANEKLPWSDALWDKNLGFNRWMRRAQATTRISRSNHMCGGCMALHAEAFSRVAFDPYISRGEDLDYLFNLRMYGLDVWFDNAWFVKHLPPATPNPANRFKQNVFRWVYEQRKLAVAAERPDLKQVTAASLMPYPGTYLGKDLAHRIRVTARRRALVSKDRVAYWDIWRNGLAQAQQNAREHERSYLAFQSWWPSIVNTLWGSAQLQEALLGGADVGAAAGAVTAAAAGTAAAPSEGAHPWH